MSFVGQIARSWQTFIIFKAKNKNIGNIPNISIDGNVIEEVQSSKFWV